VVKRALGERDRVGEGEDHRAGIEAAHHFDDFISECTSDCGQANKGSGLDERDDVHQVFDGGAVVIMAGEDYNCIQTVKITETQWDLHFLCSAISPRLS